MPFVGREGSPLCFRKDLGSHPKSHALPAAPFPTPRIFLSQYDRSSLNPCHNCYACYIFLSISFCYRCYIANILFFISTEREKTLDCASDASSELLVTSYPSHTPDTDTLSRVEVLCTFFQ